MTMRKSLFLAAVAAIAFSSCKKDGCTDPAAVNYDPEAKKDNGTCIVTGPMYKVPDTYSFENVKYSGQTDRIKMLDEMSAYMKTANTSGVVLSTVKLNEMYENTGSHYSFTSTSQLKNKTFAPDQAYFMAYFDSIALASQSVTTASDGVAGVAVSNDGTKSYLLNEYGHDLQEFIQKGLMGAVFYYQMMSTYLSDDKIGDAVDNTTVTPGEGTKMEHHWDEAFGYFGVPVDFPVNQSGLKFIGSYTNRRDAVMHLNDTIMNAFIAGRAAISNEDYANRDKKRDVIRKNIELAMAGTAISYLNKAKTHLSDDALRNHELSEAVAFVKMLKYSSAKTISDAQIQSVLNHIGNNFYQVTVQGIDNARNELSQIYQLNDIKEQL